MNYAELTDAIQDYVATRETTFVANIPVFVRKTEERVFRSVLLPELRKHAELTATAASPYVARPADFLAPFSVAVVDGTGAYQYLLEKDPEFVREAYPTATSTGLPSYYAQYDGDTAASEGNFILGPTPDANYSVIVHYYFDPPSIVDAGTTWLGDNASLVLLYGALTEAYTFIKGEADVMQMYEAKYQEAMAGLGGLARRSTVEPYRRT